MITKTISCFVFGHFYTKFKTQISTSGFLKGEGGGVGWWGGDFTLKGITSVIVFTIKRYSLKNQFVSLDKIFRKTVMLPFLPAKTKKGHT